MRVVGSRFVVLQNAVENSAGGAAPAPAEPQRMRTFGEVMDNVHAAVKQPSQITTPQSGGGQEPQPAPAAATQSPAPAPAPAAPNPMEQMLAFQAQQTQAITAAVGGMQQLVQQLAAPKPQPAEQPRPLTAQELLRGFDAPPRQTGEKDEDYLARFEQAKLDHYTARIHERATTDAKRLVEDALRQDREARRAEEQRNDGLRRYRTYLGEQTEKAGVKTGTPQHEAMLRLVDLEVQAYAPQIKTQADLQRAVEWATAKYKPMFAVQTPAPVAGVPPALSVVQPSAAPSPAATQAQPPIAGAGGGGPPATPPKDKKERPRNMNEVAQRIFRSMNRS